MRPAHRRHATPISRLGITLKTHKPQGAIVPRAIHGCPNYSFEGLARWVSSKIDEYLSQFKHLVKNPEAAKDYLCGLNLVGPASDSRFVKLDIHEFYMSGTLQQIKSTVAAALRYHDQVNMIVEVVEHLLFNQFVCGRHFVTGDDGSAYRITLGSGMGLLVSGFLADLSYFYLVDEWTLRPSTRKAYNIQGYLRFKDDILAIVGAASLDDFVKVTKHRAKFYRVTLEETSAYVVDYLNLTARRWGPEIRTTHYTKPTAKGIPLSCLSAQAPPVHHSWPGGMIRTVHRLSSERHHAQAAVKQLSDRFKHSTVPMWWPDPETVMRGIKQPRRDRTGTLWLALPYHPSIASALQSILRSVQTDLSLLFKRGPGSTLEASEITVAWMNATKPAHVQLRSLSGRKEGERGGHARA